MKSQVLFVLSVALPLCGGQNDSFLIRNATVYPVSGPKIENATLLVIDGKIAEIGPKVAMPKTKVRIIEGKGLSVYPGMIDSGTPIGLSEVSSVRETVDTGEIGEFNPQLRSIIAVNPESEHIPVTRANGITAVMVMPGQSGGGGGGGFGGGGGGGTIISGQTTLMHLSGWTWEEMEIRRGAAIQMAWPRIATFGGRGGGGEELQRMLNVPRTTFSESRRTQEQQVTKINEFFEQARRYQQAKQAGGAGLKPDLKMEAMIPVLEGKVPLMITAAREREIREAVAWAEKQRVKIVLSGVREPGKMAEELGKKKIPVILGTPFTSPAQEDDPYDEPFTLASRLHQAGVKFAMASFGTQFARNLSYEAAQGVTFGLPYEEALKSVTLNPAEIWGVADQYGSIDKGKVADLIVTDGDPLEIRTQVKMMFIKGAEVDLESKHTKLYKKYSGRP